MSRFTQNIRYALRSLRRAPGFTITAVLTLAIGLGAGSAIFCLIDGLWLRPMSVPHQGELARVFATTPQDPVGLFDYPEYLNLKQRATAFKGLAAIGRRGVLVPQPDGTSQLLLTNVVSSNFFDVLAVRPLLGRTFTAHDATLLRSHPGVVLGYRYWQRNFAGDPHVVGRTIGVRHGPSRVTQVDVWGVLPSSFREIDSNSDRDLWMSAETWVAVANPADINSTAPTALRWFNLISRLAPGAGVAQAGIQVAAIADSMAASAPAEDRGRSARVISDFRYRLAQAGSSGVVLFAIVAGVVLLCTVNVAHLLMARTLARSTEIAMRLSLGGTRWAIASQLLIENAMLCFLGWAGGLAVAAAIAALLPRLLVSEPAMLTAFGSSTHFQIDWRVFVLAGMLALATMLLLGLVPLMQGMRPELLPALQKGAVSRATGRTSVLRRAAIWVQIGISFALVVSTGALVRSFLNTRTRPIGFTRNQLLIAFTQDPDAPMRDSLVADLRAIPGVQSAAYAIRSPLMLSEGGIAAKILLPSHPEMHQAVSIKYNAVSANYLSVTGTHILHGRNFTAADDANGPPLVVISQAMARTYWPASDPIGQHVLLPGFNNGGNLNARIIGVAEDAPIDQIGELPEPYMYLPFHLSQMGEITFVVETNQNAMTLAQDVRQVLIHANPLLDPMMLTSLPELIRYSAGNYQMMAELVASLGFIGLLLTVVGLYGFLAFSVTQRRKEIGIRMALGATRESTALLILRDTARMATIGLALGAALSLAATRLEASVLFGVRPLDALSILAALCVLGLATLIAGWLPARRAATIEPMQALRTE